MDLVSSSHQEITITKHGKPIAKLTPINDEPINYYGCMAGSIEIHGDIIKPIDVEWDAEK